MARIETIAALRELIPDPGPRAAAKLRDRLCEQGIAFVRHCPFLVLGTLGTWGLELSPKGDGPGFVEIVGDRTLLIPERRGNFLALGLGNIVADPRVGLMMIRPATDEVLRISGRASLHDDAELCQRLSARGQPAVLAIRVEIDRAAFHCVRSARRAGLWQPETWDAPTKISFGRIYADALARPDIREAFDRMGGGTRRGALTPGAHGRRGRGPGSPARLPPSSRSSRAPRHVAAFARVRIQVESPPCSPSSSSSMRSSRRRSSA